MDKLTCWKLLIANVQNHWRGHDHKAWRTAEIFVVQQGCLDVGEDCSRVATAKFFKVHSLCLAKLAYHIMQWSSLVVHSHQSNLQHVNGLRQRR